MLNNPGRQTRDGTRLKNLNKGASPQTPLLLRSPLDKGDGLKKGR